jgi:hypothetical protein
VLLDVVHHRERVIGARPQGPQGDPRTVEPEHGWHDTGRGGKEQREGAKGGFHGAQLEQRGDQQHSADDEGDLHPVARQLADELLVGIRFGARVSKRAKPIDVVLSTVRDGDLSIRSDPVLNVQIRLPIGLSHDFAG